MNNMQLQYKEFLGYQFYYFDNFRSIPPLTTPHVEQFRIGATEKRLHC
jgi:hypothetical protein